MKDTGSLIKHLTQWHAVAFGDTLRHLSKITEFGPVIRGGPPKLLCQVLNVNDASELLKGPLNMGRHLWFPASNPVLVA